MSEDIYLSEIAKKCNIECTKTIRKAKELLYLLQSKKMITCSESCKVAVCLELATSLTSNPISRDCAVKYSGCKKSVYMNMFNNLSKLLGLDKVYTVKEVCLNLGISEMQVYASNLLQNYTTTNKIASDELSHPMYACAATMTACRINKVRVSLPALVGMSRIKRLELESLSKKMEKLEAERPKMKNRKRTIAEAIIDSIEHSRQDTPVKELKKLTEEEAEDEYLKWKRRMLCEG